MMPASAGRAVWLLACLRLKRLANLFTSFRFKAKAGQASRPATRTKRRMGGVFVVLMAASMLFSFSNIARQSVLNLECHLSPLASYCVGFKAKDDDRDGNQIAARALQQEGITPPLARAMTLQLSLLLVVSFLTPLGSRELANTDGDLEWLVTLPVKRATLLLARIVERSVANPTGLMAMMPVCLMVAWFSGYRWSVPLLALAGALALLPIAAVLRTVVDTGLRMVLSPSQLRNLQAVCGVASLPFMYLAMSFGMPSVSTIGIPLARAVPDWMLWTPPGLVIEALIARTPAQAGAMIGLLLVELAACIALGMVVLRHQLRDGVVASGVRESARRPSNATARRAAIGNSMWRRLLPRSAMQRRELRLLGRDRNFLVQSLVMPIVIVAPQFFFNSRHGSLAELGSHPVGLALAAWGISAYMLMLSAFQTLNNEGQVLWMLYTFPRSLESVLKEKAKLWAVLALAYPLAVLGVGIAVAPAFDWHILSTCAIVLAGVPVYSMIAVALGVFASDPLAQDARTRLRPSYLYLYMLLASLYAYAIYADLWWQTVVVMVLTACLAQALWQKARDCLPYLLDPAAAPPSRVSSADGMMTAMLFFVLQAVAGLIFVSAEMAPGQAIVLAFGIAGALVYVLTRYTYWRTKTLGVPKLLSGHPGRALGWGIGLGIAAAAVGLAYLFVLRTMPWWPGQVQANAGVRIPAYWLLLLTVLLAPLCEEFIFRGLVFGGLRRSLGLPLSMVMSAALFAIVHPPMSMLPVFGLGLFTAFAYERGKGLLAPMLVHAIYNAAVVGYQLGL